MTNAGATIRLDPNGTSLVELFVAQSHVSVWAGRGDDRTGRPSRRGYVVALTSATGIGVVDFGDWFGHLHPRPREDRFRPSVSPDLGVAGSIVDVVDHPGRGAAVSDVLAAWRAAERELAAIPSGSPAWTNTRTRALELRASYHQLFNEHLHRWPGL